MEFTEIKEIVVREIIPKKEAIIGGKMRIDADGFEEYRWGWMVYLEAVEPLSCTNQSLADCKFLFLIHRKTGYWQSGRPSPVLITRFLEAVGEQPQDGDEDPVPA